MSAPAREILIANAREFDPGRGAFSPATTPGRTRREMENKGPAREGKTRRKRGKR